MKTTDIILIVIAIFLLYSLYIDNNTQPVIDKFTPNYIRINKQDKPKIIEKFEGIEYYPINFTISPTVTYIPDDCLPLNFMFDPSTNTIMLNGSGQIVATDQSLNPIVTTSPIILNLILSKSGTLDSQLPVSNIKFSISKCNNNSSITITNDNSNSTTLGNNYDSISGNIMIGLITFNINKIIFGTTPTLKSIFTQNPANNNVNFTLPTICNIASCGVAPSATSNLASIITAPPNLIDNLINDDKQFALYTYITKQGIPSEVFNDQTKYKVYLSVGFENDGINTKTIKFTNSLTQGSIFKASMSKKFIRMTTVPFKYLDFYKVLINGAGEKTLQSNFYNIFLVKNNYSLTYCLEGCDQNNVNGFIAQENPENNRNKMSAFTNKQDDKFGLKNFMKFRFESDGGITPYFLSYSNNIEKIYFITNKYNSSLDKNAYNKAVQVPIYTDKGPFFELPDLLIDSKGISYPTVTNVAITGLNTPYSDEELTNYNQAASLLQDDTKAFMNDAYQKYALKFFVEEIDPTVKILEKLPLNELDI
jgi:hypothetical protein